VPGRCQGESLAASGHSSKTRLLYGPYVGGMLRYNFNKNWGVLAQYSFITVAGRHLGAVQAGISYRF